MPLSDRVKAVAESATLAISAKAKAMIKSGEDVVVLSAGEPDFAPPQKLKDALIEAVKENKSRYAPSGGLPELKEAVVEKYSRENGVSYEPSEVIITTGAKEALYLIMQTVVNPGDDVILFSPFWVSYLEQVKLAGGNPIVVRGFMSDRFKINIDTLEEFITPRTKLLVLNYPSNPAGVIYSKEELKKLGELALKHGFYIVSDEIYEKYVYEGEFVSISSISDDIKSRVVVVNGLSKTFAVPGWRLGYAIGNKDIIKGMTKIKSHSTSNAPSIVQYAAVEALKMSEDEVNTLIAPFKSRRDLICSMLMDIDGIELVEPAGSFYVFPKVSAFYGRNLGGVDVVDSVSFSSALLEKAKVAVVPGVAFGEDEFVRISFASSKDNIKRGVERMAEFLGG